MWRHHRSMVVKSYVMTTKWYASVLVIIYSHFLVLSSINVSIYGFISKFLLFCWVSRDISWKEFTKDKTQKSITQQLTVIQMILLQFKSFTWLERISLSVPLLFCFSCFWMNPDLGLLFGFIMSSIIGDIGILLILSIYIDWFGLFCMRSTYTVSSLGSLLLTAKALTPESSPSRPLPSALGYIPLSRSLGSP